MPGLKIQTQCQGYRGATDRHNARATDTVPGLQRHIARAKDNARATDTDTIPRLQTQHNARATDTQSQGYRHSASAIDTMPRLQTMPGLQSHCQRDGQCRGHRHGARLTEVSTLVRSTEMRVIKF